MAGDLTTLLGQHLSTELESAANRSSQDFGTTRLTKAEHQKIGTRLGEIGSTARLPMEGKMAKELALIEPIQLPATSNPARLPLLPAWLQRRSDAVENARQPDAQGQHREMPTLPASLILNLEQRQSVERHIAGLSQFLDLKQPIELREKVLTNDQAHGVLIAGLLIKGGGQKLDKQSADALTEDYLDAIEDLPAWTVREALRKWNRAESPQLGKKPHDFDWKPVPPTLRRLAYWELWAIKGRILQLEKILAAVPLIEFSDDHRKSMLKRLAALVRAAATPAPIPENYFAYPAEAAE
jgi:hypothetical protein